MSKTLTTPQAVKTLTVQISAEHLELDVDVVGGLTQPTAILSGPRDVLDRIRDTRDGDLWTLHWPRGSGNYAGITIQDGDCMSVNIGGSVRGRIIINGVDVTGVAGNARQEPLQAVVRIPAGSALIARVGSGMIRTSGTLATVQADTVSAAIRCAGPAARFAATTVSGRITAEDTGPADIRTTSGTVRLRGARGAVTFRSVSGDIEVHALGSVNIRGNTISGAVLVTAAPGVVPVVDANSVSGRIRISR